MYTQLYMVRHAESSYSLGEDRTRGLTPQGQENVSRMGELLRDKKIDAVVSSPYVRARLTVQGIADERGLPVMTYEELRERQLHGEEYHLSAEAFPKAIEQSFSDHDLALPGGESFREARERAVPVIKQLVQDYRGKSVAVGTHGNILTMILNAFDPSYGLAFWQSTSMPDVYRLSFDGDELLGVERLWS